MQRKVVYTSEIIAFANVDDNVKIDEIRMVDISIIRIMETKTDEYADEKNSEKQSESFVIETKHDGHNKGRVYYLKADNHATCVAAVKAIRRLAKYAQFRANANSRLSRSQYFVRKVFRSTPFQYASASVTILVRPNHDKFFTFFSRSKRFP